MDNPPDFQRLRRRLVRGSADEPRGEGITVAPGRRGRNPGTDTRATTALRGVDDPQILCLLRAAAANTPLARGRMA
jgi:hypothetical protein